MHFTQRRKGYAKETSSFALVVFAVALQWYAHAGGLLKTADSCSYLAAAESFDSGYRYWSPLFPLILSLFGKSWQWIHLLLTACIGVLIVSQTRKIIKDDVIAFVCQCSILLGVHLLLIGVFLWSELLFLLLLLLFIRSLQENFVVAIILGFLLCLQRNAGLFFVIGAAIWYWDLRKSLILFLLSSSGFFAWNVYTSAAAEQEYFQSTIHNFNVISTGLMRGLAPVPGVILLCVVGWLLWVLKSDSQSRLPGILLISYIVGMTVLFPLDIYDADRYAAIVIPFLMILVFRAVEIAAAKQTSTVRKLLMVLIICWLAYPLSRTVKNALQWHKVSFTSYFCAVQS